VEGDGWTGAHPPPVIFFSLSHRPRKRSHPTHPTLPCIHRRPTSPGHPIPGSGLISEGIGQRSAPLPSPAFSFTLLTLRWAGLAASADTGAAAADQARADGRLPARWPARRRRAAASIMCVEGREEGALTWGRAKRESQGVRARAKSRPEFFAALSCCVGPWPGLWPFSCLNHAPPATHASPSSQELGRARVRGGGAPW